MEAGFKLPVIVATAETATALSEAQVIQEQLKAINIEVEIESLEFGTYVDRWLAADFTAAIALNGGRPDPYPMYSRYFQYGAQFENVAGYVDDTLDSLMKAGQTETDPAKRYEIFAEFQKHLAETAPWIWLYTQYNYTAQHVTDTPTPTGYLFYRRNQAQPLRFSRGPLDFVGAYCNTPLPGGASPAPTKNRRALDLYLSVRLLTISQAPCIRKRFFC
jgi:ABC-type transport system substrate-binding protein